MVVDILGLEITQRCNFNCVWCGVEKSSKTLPLSDFKKLIIKFQPKTVWLTGGEPLLVNNLKKYVDFCKKKNLPVYLNTNGSLITKEILDTLDGVEYFCISVDGLEEVNDKIRGKGRFAGVERAVDLLYMEGKSDKVRINITLGKLNRNQANKIIHHFYPKIKRFSISRVMASGPHSKEIEKLTLGRAEMLYRKAEILLRNLLLPAKIEFSMEFGGVFANGLTGPFIIIDGTVVRCCGLRTKTNSLEPLYCTRVLSGCVECVKKSNYKRLKTNRGMNTK